jgi:hypothetical protein
MHRDVLFTGVTKALARVLLPVAFLRYGRRAHLVAAQWALGLRFPAEDLRGLAPAVRAAFTAARTEAFWRDGQLLGLTSGHRDAATQHRMFVDEVCRTGSVRAARRRVLPPDESPHVRGLAIDVRPFEGARWLEAHGWRFGLYRIYDNEWWHFEHRAGGPPRRLPHPGASPPPLAAPGRRTAAWR